MNKLLSKAVIKKAISRCALTIAALSSFALASAQTVTTWQYSGGYYPSLESRGVEYKAVAASEQGEIGLRYDGSIDVAGNDPFGELHLPNDLRATAIAAACNVTMFLQADGTVKCFGYEEGGAHIVPDGLTDVVQIAAGIEHCMALKADGTVVAWGSNYFGQCNVPSSLTDVVKIYAGGESSYALKADGTVVSWGQITAPSGLSNVTDIAVGGSFTLFLKSDGTIDLEAPYNWEGIKDVPDGLTDIVKVGAAWNTAFAIRADGSVVAWGDNRGGQCEIPAGIDPVLTIAGGSLRVIALTGVAGSLTPSKSSVVGGSATTVKATLDLAKPAPTDLVFTLESSDPYLTNVPGTVTVPAGASSATFTIDHDVIGVTEPVTITATHGLSQISTTITLKPNLIKSIGLDARSIEGGTTISGFINLTSAPKKNLVVDLESDGPIATVPASVTVRGGATVAVFTVNLNDVPLTARAYISAKLRGNTTTTYVTILPKIKLKSIVVSASTFYGNQIVHGTVVLKTPAGPGGVTVNLSSTNGGISFPATAYVREGLTVGNFDITGMDVSSVTPTDIVATYSFSTLSKTLNVKPMTLTGIALNPASVQGGFSTDINVSLIAAVDVDTTVTLSAAIPSLVTLPTTIVIPAGSAGATVSLTAKPTTVTKTTTIRATRLGKTKTQTLTITP